MLSNNIVGLLYNKIVKGWAVGTALLVLTQRPSKICSVHGTKELLVRRKASQEYFDFQTITLPKVMRIIQSRAFHAMYRTPK